MSGLLRRRVEPIAVSPQWEVATNIVAELKGDDSNCEKLRDEERERRVREMRKLRARVFEFLQKVNKQNISAFLVLWTRFVLDRKTDNVFFKRVQSVFKVYAEELKADAFFLLRDKSVEMKKMRQAGRKFAMWFLKKELTTSWGAWIAVWAHYKDWRVCSLTGCLQSRLKTTTKEELGMFIRSSRGTALLREFSDAPVSDLAEKIVANRLDVEALATLSVDDLFEAGVFTIQRSNKAHGLLNKISQLFLESTERLDSLTIFNGAMLNQITIFEDEGEQKLKNSGGKKDQSKQNRSTSSNDTTAVLLSPVLDGTIKTSKLNANSDIQSKEWAWGYSLHIKAAAVTIQSLRFLLVLHEGCSAWGHIQDATTGLELAKSQPASGKGGGEEWYQFLFGSTVTGTFQQQWIKLPDPDSSGLVNLAIYIHCSAASSGRPPNQFVYVVDHRPGRRLNAYMTVDAASFDGDGHSVRKSRHIIGELAVVPAAGFDLDHGPSEAVPPEELEDEVAALAAEIDRLKADIGDVSSDEKTASMLQQKRLKLRRIALDNADEPLERRLGRMPDSFLNLDVPSQGACAFNFRTEEYWVVDTATTGGALRVWCCGLDGTLRRTLFLENVPRMFALSFDRAGCFYMCDSERSCYAFRPVQSAVADRFLRSWVTRITDGESISGCAWWAEHVYCVFMRGPIVILDQTYGIRKQVIQLRFIPVNITSMVAAMGRLVISDSDSIRVCSLDGLAITVPDLPEPDGRGGMRPMWKDRIAGALDNPRIMWDGSFLWVAELQLRVTQENQVLARNFAWICYGPITESDPTRYGIRRVMDLRVWREKPDVVWTGLKPSVATVSDSGNEPAKSTGVEGRLRCSVAFESAKEDRPVPHPK